MLLETALALEKKLKGLTVVSKDVTITTDEGYAEVVANATRNKAEVKYPVVVMRSKDVAFDRSRYSNDNVNVRYREVEEDGVLKIYNDFDEPYQPYNLMYQVDLIATSRRDIDTMVMWVMGNIKDRDCIDVVYKDYDDNDAVYQSLTKRGNIIRADDIENNIVRLHRRIFDLRLSTMIAVNALKSEIVLTGDTNGDTVKFEMNQI